MNESTDGGSAARPGSDAGSRHWWRRRAQVRSRTWWEDHPFALRGVTVLTLLVGMAYLTWRIGWSGQGAAPGSYWVLLAAELYGFVNLALYAWIGWSVPATRRPARHGAPSVDIFVCTYDEPLEVLEPTLVGCRAVTYPHTTYLLDDGRRPAVAELAGELGAIYLTRPDNAHAKAGNINHALPLTDGELVLVLDADHVPHPEILDATVGYFDDPKVALVQTPHDFFNRDSVQHTREDRHEQSLFYEVLAPGKDRVGAMFWCGSAGVIRREALEGVGGVLTDTIAEDFHTTIALHANGWESRYHGETLVQGLAPHNLGAFLLQRERWARGNLRVFRTRQNPVWCRGLSMRQRFSYLASLSNYFSGLQRALLLGVLVATLLTGRLPMTATPAILLALWLPWALLGFATSKALARGRLGPFDASIYGFETMSVYIRALAALVWPRVGRFRVTPKEGADLGGVEVLQRLAFLVSFGVLIFFALIARGLEATGLLALPSMPGLALAVTLAAGVWELGLITATLVPLVRRRQLRLRYRFPVALQGRIDQSIVGVVDLTPTGAAFLAPRSRTAGSVGSLGLRLPGADGRIQELDVPFLVRSARPTDDEAWRIGVEFVDLDPMRRRRLTEYCFVVRQASREPFESTGSAESDRSAASDTGESVASAS